MNSATKSSTLPFFACTAPTSACEFSPARQQHVLPICDRKADCRPLPRRTARLRCLHGSAAVALMSKPLRCVAMHSSSSFVPRAAQAWMADQPARSSENSDACDSACRAVRSPSAPAGPAPAAATAPNRKSCSAVLPMASLTCAAVWSAASSSSMTAACPSAEARCSAVRPQWSKALACAPAASSSSQRAESPRRAAQCSGAHPRASMARRSRSCAHCRCMAATSGIVRRTIPRGRRSWQAWNTLANSASTSRSTDLADG